MLYLSTLVRNKLILKGYPSSSRFSFDDAICIPAKTCVMYPAIWFLTFGVAPCTSILTACLLLLKFLENLLGKRLMSSLAIRLIRSVRTLPKLQFPPSAH